MIEVHLWLFKMCKKNGRNEINALRYYTEKPDRCLMWCFLSTVRYGVVKWMHQTVCRCIHTGGVPDGCKICTVHQGRVSTSITCFISDTCKLNWLSSHCIALTGASFCVLVQTNVSINNVLVTTCILRFYL